MYDRSITVEKEKESGCSTRQTVTQTTTQHKRLSLSRTSRRTAGAPSCFNNELSPNRVPVIETRRRHERNEDFHIKRINNEGEKVLGSYGFRVVRRLAKNIHNRQITFPASHTTVHHLIYISFPQSHFLVFLFSRSRGVLSLTFAQ